MNNLHAMLAKIVGAILVLVGIAGFVTGDTLVIFGVNVLHNVIHLLTGAVLLWAGLANGGTHARIVTQVVGIAYVLVALMGFAGWMIPDMLGMSGDTIAHADNILHLIVGLALAGAGFAMKETMDRPAAGA